MSLICRPCATASALCLILAAASPAAQAALSYADAQREAVARSSGLIARANAVEAAQASRIAAGRLPDPRLLFGLDNVPVTGPDRGSLTADFMTMRRVGLMQDFPNANKRKASEDAAEAAIARATAERQLDSLMIRRAAALAWSDRYYGEGRLTLIEAVTEENRLLDVVVRAQIASGKANALDILAVEQERAAIDDRRDEMEHEIHAAEARLARYLGERAREPLSGRPPLQPASTDVADRLDQSPELRLFEPLRAMAQAEVHAADAAQRPDWGLEVSYAQRGAAYSNMVSVQISVDLPLFLSTRQAPRLAARRSDAARVDAEREDRRRELEASLEESWAQYADLRSRLRRAREITTALAHRRVDTALNEYRAGRIELQQVVAARREKVEAELRALELEQRLSQVIIRLDTVIDEVLP
ncbi:MAG TPA: TolC family protein [Casimicrobiaceae bacterium]|nr:TolC family protein [Casimicrobiaceae bacterium]